MWVFFDVNHIITDDNEISRIIKKWAQETYHLDRPNPMGIKRRNNIYVVENIV